MSNFIEKTDYKGRPYFDFKNIRVTLVTLGEGEANKNWAGDGEEANKNWSGKRYLQILAYQDAEMTKTHPGPQIPITIRDDEKFGSITALRAFYGTLVGVTGDE